MLIPVLLLLLGFGVLIKGADFLVNGASSVAKKYGISNLAIGLTVVAFGTSMPELIVSLLSALNGKNDASFGNAIGSNNFNLLFILGIAGLIYPLVVQRNTVKYEVPLSLLAAGLLFLLVNDSLWGGEGAGSLSRIDSIILLAFFAGFIFYIYRTMSRNTDLEEGEPIKIYSMPLAIGMVTLGLAMLIGGGQLVVTNALEIARAYGLSEKLIGLTILAAGTSLPELATSCVAAYRKNTDIAIGNVVGSNIFNIFFILGITGVVNPMAYNAAMNFDLYVLMGSTVLLLIFMFTLGRRKLDRWEAAILFGGYIVYTVYLIGLDNGTV
ncbi:MAG: calcium/sodium antiporter [Cytophagales bacterium]|jgi:cation:H+ antiporter|nr:calcium/sodium antiporter [Cytophagales bacterium]MCA6378769.1 calcium/sodium antiporter [Cytophagales bacterium]MCA6387812.1 calcium/sodium antiporter [Cytophagales bacterium]MCA6390527.1 calcium/sodium antiporter [Cytophagales bacterium]MCA6395580.1 calcium/sodium antiporter [Cytophagales bacterium]